jgi:hypothetical protein
MSGERIFKVCGSGLIADVSAWWVDTQTARVNASLIAAAPDLLAALEWAIGALAEPIHGDGSLYGREYANARAAIAKATGKLDGCGAIGPEGYRCTHHEHGEHVARGTEPDSWADAWPITT